MVSLSRFRVCRFDSIWINTYLLELLFTPLAMRFGRLCVATLVIALSGQFRFVSCLLKSRRQVLDFKEYVHCTSYLFGTESFSILDVFADAILLTHPSTEQVAENH